MGFTISSGLRFKVYHSSQCSQFHFLENKKAIDIISGHLRKVLRFVEAVRIADFDLWAMLHFEAKHFF
jgi:hypothetical protein